MPGHDPGGQQGEKGRRSTSEVAKSLERGAQVTVAAAGLGARNTVVAIISKSPVGGVHSGKGSRDHEGGQKDELNIGEYLKQCRQFWRVTEDLHPVTTCICLGHLVMILVVG